MEFPKKFLATQYPCGHCLHIECSDDLITTAENDCESLYQANSSSIILCMRPVKVLGADGFQREDDMGKKL